MPSKNHVPERKKRVALEAITNKKLLRALLMKIIPAVSL
jgi:hypothetical protein